jgi:transposase
MCDSHPLSMTRKRAHSILLSDKKYPISIIADMLGVCRQSVSQWIKAWNDIGLSALIEKKKSGRPRKLSIDIENEVIDLIKKKPRSVKRLLSEIIEKTGILICKDTLRRTCKRAGLKWKRIKKILKNKKDHEAFNECVEMITELLERQVSGEIDLRFFDESSFNLEPCVPYAWQPKGENIEVPTSSSQSLNVLGFINRHCELESFVFEGSVNSDVVVACFEEFVETIEKTTYVLVDNAPAHTSDFFLAHLSQWEDSGLYVKHLSAYSPELNIIEILWRKIKYDWMPFSATQSLSHLRAELFNILKNLGSEYIIAYA